MSTSTVASFALILIVGLYIVRLLLRKPPVPLPPGPSPKFLVGNIADLPRRGGQEWLHWLQHKDLYGPISSVTSLGKTIIILNDVQTTIDLMEKRSAIYSSRPKMAFAGEMIGWHDTLGLLPYSDRFRTYRKTLHRALGTSSAVARFTSLQEVEIRRFLLRVLREPDALLQHIRTEVGAVILKISYGYTIQPHTNDPLVDLANDAMTQLSMAATPGAWLVDIIPLMKYLPAWFPGAGFKQAAIEWRRTLMKTIDTPYAFVQQQMKSAAHEPSVLASLLENARVIPGSEEEHVAKLSSSSLYTGGADTTVSSLSFFFLAMALFPEIQQKAQHEIDKVIGNTKLPSFNDRAKLPYIDALVKEVLRWQPVAPTGVPHASIADDIYQGYFIPKGSVIIANIWGFMHDPSTYPDPMAFKPERFLDTDGHIPEPDPHNVAFGFGRRVCPGRILADSTIFLTIAQSLAVFKISKPIHDGKEAELKVDFLPGFICHPKPFKVNVQLRSLAHEGLIQSIEIDHPWEESHAPFLNI
ncbi:hypothetical protein ASPWEDRAFT_117096 [Aspergillus wentii DTO 134E9]|uniref:Cytochrome P450 n=1 Tax=Aspergillus wentii DTO 134E9 TaxID=1073089 RepID=A0A1L9RBU3_ASPWE|nr:uncharacterized protein ASPWEDRAFT_117096 [Aspergillus wentii DTO 134E9]OJJ32368.1 hypothetical protein ASPWEDRAFT_117096 [Aspergillus wentii DTO 134E9]